VSADRITLRWVGLYTRGLPAEVGDERRNEVVSDLWEHRADAGRGLRTELRIVSRLARGVPADLTWRRARCRGRRLLAPRSAARGLGWTLALLSYLFMVGQFSWAATALVGLDLYGEDWAPGDVAWFSRIAGVLLALLVGGAALIPCRPRIGATLVIAGLVVTPLVFWWAAPMYVPLGLAVGAAVIVLARRRRGYHAPAA
jgi:hypothetical protein